jgi:hypothetical protein
VVEPDFPGTEGNTLIPTADAVELCRGWFPDIPLFNALLDGLSTLLAYGVDVLVELAIPGF